MLFWGVEKLKWQGEKKQETSLLHYLILLLLNTKHGSTSRNLRGKVAWFFVGLGVLHLFDGWFGKGTETWHPYLGPCCITHIHKVLCPCCIHILIYLFFFKICGVMLCLVVLSCHAVYTLDPSTCIVSCCVPYLCRCCKGKILLFSYM